jgi:hypothetical protein
MGQLLGRAINPQAGGSFASTNVPVEEARELFHEVDVDNAHGFHETLSSKRCVRSATTDNFEQLLQEFSVPLERYVRAMLLRFQSVRVAVFVHTTYTKVSNTAVAPIPPLAPVLRTRLLAVLRAHAIPQFVHDVLETLRTRHATFMSESSGLRLESTRMGDIQITKVEHMSYAGNAYTELPEFLEKKHAIVNVRNKDNRCFGYALLSSLHPTTDHVSRRTHYDHFFVVHPTRNGLDYPIEIDQFEDIEERINIPFNVYTFYDDEGRARYPLYISREDPDTAIDLLLWKGHYAWIKSFTRFLGDENPNRHKRFYCKRCFGRFTVQTALNNHRKFCTAMDCCKQVYTMPKEGTKLTFKNVRHQVRFPFVVYADFEERGNAYENES